MNDWKHSLRKTVEYWLSPSPAALVRVLRFKNRRRTNECFVKVTTSDSSRDAEMYFFRHDDGTWRVFPPNGALPALTYPKFS
ncbi:hypothetical protein [Paraburkholderia hospita]|uniref:Uncharacterized protein n=1 Tax=Paraburkholderia hospita TaxID=169430 RepID=A0ABP2PQW9_9BURK|nr:hypothetical protein [Paraburkholderia hospita]EIM99968.1 hypothetical protein WQE_16604 [Paraburkholderia hospita]OUL73915.1 hypothetical protein CA602_40060 [Paraburkholderia hospita]SEI15675.1 hypothetical protein SAMN05192544_1026123 [Paraburkholderia hospita]